MTCEQKVKQIYPKAVCLSGGYMPVRNTVYDDSTVPLPDRKVLGRSVGDQRRAWSDAVRNIVASDPWDGVESAPSPAPEAAR